MEHDDRSRGETVELRPVIGLTQGLSKSDLEVLTVDAILQHRRLSEEAEVLYQALPEELQAGREFGGPKHLEYIRAMIHMHAQMAVLSSLLNVLGYTPAVHEIN